MVLYTAEDITGSSVEMNVVGSWENQAVAGIETRRSRQNAAFDWSAGGLRREHYPNLRQPFPLVCGRDASSTE